MAGERDVLSAEERQELRDEPMLVHTFDAHRLVRLLLAASSLEPLPREALDVERLGFGDLLDIADALLTHYPPDTIVCSHLERADIGAQTAAAISDLVASCRAALSPDRPTPP